MSRVWAGMGFLLLVVMPAMAAPGLTLTALKPNVYIAEDDFYIRENSLVYVGRDHVTVIGATWTPAIAELLVREIKKITPLPVSEVIDTNHDLDRTGGNAYFRQIGAHIIATALTRDLLANEGEAARRSLQTDFADFPAVPIVLPDTIVGADFTLQNGAVRGFYIGPSHKPDDIFVWLPNEKVLYGGCVLKEQLGNMAGADPAAYRKTLTALKAMKLPIETIVAGHWSAVHGPELIDQYLGLLAAYKP